MVKSMTGYGRARETRNKRDITVEVRSVNNRYLDCTMKLPRAYVFAEDAIKGRVQKAGVTGQGGRVRHHRLLRCGRVRGEGERAAGPATMRRCCS